MLGWKDYKASRRTPFGQFSLATSGGTLQSVHVYGYPRIHMWLLLQAALSPVNFIVSPCVWMSQMTHVAAATGSVSGEVQVGRVAIESPH